MQTSPVHHHWYDVHPFTQRHRDLLAGVWRLVDPKIALASIVPFVAGLALAISGSGSVRWGVAAAAFLAIFLVEVGKNAINDLCDYESDVAVRPDERSPFSGGKRVLVDHLMTRNDLVIAAWVAFALAGLIGIEVASQTRPMLLVLGAVAAAISVLYALPPVRLSARGFGELAVFAVYGPGIVLGTMLLFRAPITLEAVLAAVSFGLLIANVLLINEVPDERADRAAGKGTLVVRLGRERTGTLFAWVFLAAFAIPIIAAMYGLAPFRLVAFLVGLPVAVLSETALRKTPAGPPVGAQGATLATYVATAIGYSAAVLLS